MQFIAGSLLRTESSKKKNLAGHKIGFLELRIKYIVYRSSRHATNKSLFAYGTISIILVKLFFPCKKIRLLLDRYKYTIGSGS